MIGLYKCECGCEMVVYFVEMKPLISVECQECHGRAKICPATVYDIGFMVCECGHIGHAHVVVGGVHYDQCVKCSCLRFQTRGQTSGL